MVLVGHSYSSPVITYARVPQLVHRRVAACKPDDDRLAELNQQFHFRVYECARSPMLLLLMRLLWRSFPRGPQSGRPHRESVRQHAQLLRALKRRDEDSWLPSCATTCWAAFSTCQGHEHAP